MDLEVAVPTQSYFKKRRKDNLNSELNADSFQCDEESFHILAGIISLDVINQVITSYQKPAMDRLDHPYEPGLPDSDTLSKIKMLWQQNLSKIGGLPISTAAKVQSDFSQVSTRLLEECPPISAVQGRRVKAKIFMDNCINQENPNASIMHIDGLGIEKKITLSTLEPSGETVGRQPINNRPSFSANRLGLVRTAAKKTTKTRISDNIDEKNLLPRDMSSPIPPFDVLAGMTILIRQSSEFSIEDWKRRYCTTTEDNFTLQIPPPLSSQSQSSSSSSSASLWISGVVQNVDRLRDSLHKIALKFSTISSIDKKAIRQQYSHLLTIRLKDGSIVKVFWPDPKLLRLPSMEIQDPGAEKQAENNPLVPVAGGDESKPTDPTAMEMMLLQEMFSSDSDESDNHSDSESDDSVSNDGFMELLQHHSPSYSQSDAAQTAEDSGQKQDDDVYAKSLQSIGGADDTVAVPAKHFSSLLSYTNVKDVLLSTGGQRVTKRQIEEIDERFERWKSSEYKPIFKILPQNDPKKRVEAVVDGLCIDDGDAEDSTAPDVIIIGETEKGFNVTFSTFLNLTAKLTRRNYQWIAKLENVYIRFCQPTVYEVAIPSLKCSMNASAFEKGEPLLSKLT